MGVLKLLVLCAIIVVAICEENKNNQTNPTTVIENRCKRETEIDSHSRDHKIKLPSNPLKSPKFIRFVPVSNTFVPLRSRMLPVTQNKPTPLKNTTEETNQLSSVTNKNNDIKVTKDAELNESIKSAVSGSVNSQTFDKTQSNREEREEKIDESSAESVPQIVTKEGNKNKPADIFNKKQEERTVTKELKTPALKEVKEDVPHSVDINGPILNEKEKKVSTSSLSNLKLQHNTPAKFTPTHNKPSESKINKSTITVKKDNKLENNPVQIDTVDQPLNRVTDVIKTAKTSAQVSLNMNPLLNKASLTKTPISKTSIFPAHLTVKPKITEINTTNKTVDISPRESVVSKNENDVENELEVPLECIKIEPNEELVIENSNYEELFESSAPRYLSQKFIASELRPAQNLNSNPTIPTYRTYFDKSVNSNKPYSYDIKKYPDQYVINTFDESTNTADKNNFNEYTINGDQSNDYCSYYQPQVNIGQRTKFNYNQGQHPNKIWRSWRKNQIVVRPKSTNLLNIDELYAKGHLTNIGNVPAHNIAANVISSNVGNHNMSPYSYCNPPHFRNGY